MGGGMEGRPERDEPAPFGVACRTVILPHHQRRGRHEVSPLSSHADRNSCLSCDSSRTHVEIATPVLERAAAGIHKLLMNIPLRVSVIYLSLWYISRLVPAGFIEPHRFYGPGCIELVNRLFMVGLIIANKWHEDMAFRTREW